MNEHLKIKIQGHVNIRDAVTGALILAKSNAVHPQNMALAIARSLAKDANGSIFKMSFGNGGTFFNSSQQIIYRSPNTIGSLSDLYNPTHEVQVDEQDSLTPVTNSVTSAASPNPAITSMVTIVAELGPGEPIGQAVADNLTTNPESLFVFDEIGLKTQDNLLLSHLIFSPIEKTANRAFVITYTLTISVS
jgi:hypothetical protein